MTQAQSVPFAQALASDIPWPAKNLVRLGGGVVVSLLLLFGAWGSLAKLDSAVVTNGEFRASANRQSVQHLTGGTITNIMVANGDLVRKGQPLIQLDKSGLDAKLAVMKARMIHSRAEIDRLSAEARNADTVTFAMVPSQSSADAVAIRATQDAEVALFMARRENLQKQMVALTVQAHTAAVTIDSIKREIIERRSQLDLVAEQLKRRKDMLSNGLGTQDEYYAVALQHSQLLGDLTRLLRDQTAQEELANQIAAEKDKIQAQAGESIETDLNRARKELDETGKGIADGLQEIEKQTMRAPADGIVTGLAVHTVGGVVPPGQQIAFITPEHSPLIIEASVSPSDIDVITPGMETTVRLSALNREKAPEISAVVKRVSADSLTVQDNLRVYVAEIELNPAEAASYPIRPGMPAEVYIKTGRRTFWNYLTKPLFDRFARSLKEE